MGGGRLPLRERETARLRLRAWRDDDLERLVALYADARVARYLNRMGGPIPRTVTERVFDHIRQMWAERGYGPWAVEETATGRWIGEIGLNLLPDWPGPHQVEVGWELDPSVWGRGLATEGGWEAVRCGFEEVGLDRVISVCNPANAASRRVMAKCGLTYQGEQVYRDVTTVWYALDRAGWEARHSSQPESPEGPPGAAVP